MEFYFSDTGVEIMHSLFYVVFCKPDYYIYTN